MTPVRFSLQADDTIIYESHTTGIRYRCDVKEVRSDGWAIDKDGFGLSSSTSFHHDHWLLVSVARKVNGKIRTVYQFYIEEKP